MTLTVMADGGVELVMVMEAAADLPASAADFAARVTVEGDGAFDGAV